jgi:hypothetical protein
MFTTVGKSWFARSAKESGAGRANAGVNAAGAEIASAVVAMARNKRNIEKRI